MMMLVTVEMTEYMTTPITSFLKSTLLSSFSCDSGLTRLLPVAAMSAKISRILPSLATFSSTPAARGLDSLLPTAL